MDDSKYSALRAYLARGWALVPVHHVVNRVCTCGDPGCRSAGKHPRLKRWQEPAQLVTDAATLRALHQAHPGWNWGVATGPVSGIWFLDVDDVEAWARLLGAVDARPEHVHTWHQRTGGGGLQYAFALPPDFVPNNSAGRLPAGIDVRGARRGEASGGQVVIAPSVSGKGPYTVLADVEPIRAPTWLEELIRPAPPRHKVHAAPGEPIPTVTVESADRLTRYASTAVTRICDDLADLPGGRNNAGIKAAYRLVELCNASWAALDQEEVYETFIAAVLAHPLGIAVPESEAERLWANAVRHVGDREAEPPAENMAPPLEGGDHIPFDSLSTAGAPGSSTGQQQTRPDETGENPQAGGQIGGQVNDQAAAFDAEVARQMFRMAAIEEARRRLDARALADREGAVAQMLGALLDTEGLDSVPPLVPVVDGMLAMDSLARVIGPSGHGKSFVMLDIAGRVATGMDWAGRPVRQGPVLYMVAEGIAGMRSRVRAWEELHARQMTGVRFLPMPVQARAAEWDVFIEVARKLEPSLIVLDTQARVTVGVEENSATEMGVVVDAMERLRRSTGACVALVHHRGLTGEHARGSTAVKGALQTELDVERINGIVSVKTIKQKDWPETDPIAFRLVSVRVSDVSRDVSSADETDETVLRDGGSTEGEVIGAALEWLTTPASRGPIVPDGELLGAVGMLAEIASEVFAKGNGGTKAEFQRVAVDQRHKLSRATFYRAWGELVSRGIVARIRGMQQWRYMPVDERAKLIEPISDADGSAGFYAP